MKTARDITSSPLHISLSRNLKISPSNLLTTLSNAAKRHGKTLKYLPVVEGERSGKHLHLHFAIGNLPKHVRFNQFDALVCEAKKYVEHVDEQHKVDIADSGWLEYITKETATKHSENVL